MKKIYIILLLFVFITLSKPTTFSTCSVKVTKMIIPEQTTKEILIKRQHSGIFEDCSNMDDSLILYNKHAFFDAVYYAYARHKPLVISPDIMWLTICQGFANHVNANPEKLRHYFVDFEGQDTIEVTRDEFIKGSTENDWEGVFPEFIDSIKKRVKDDICNTIVAKYSTSGPVERAAYALTLMNAMQHYFSYAHRVICGIPEITIEGTRGDWKKLKRRTEKLGKYELQWWTDSLAPILNQFIAAKEGTIDTTFWNSIFIKNEYGQGCGQITLINGWIIKLFPYIGGDDRKHHKSRYIQSADYSTDGVLPKDIPSGIAKTDFKWKSNDTTYKMHFLSGFVGIEQDKKTFALKPKIGWAVFHIPTTDFKYPVMLYKWSSLFHYDDIEANEDTTQE